MKNKIAVACLLILIPAVPFLITGCASPGPLAVKQASYPEAKVDAPGLFVENCAVCHGKNGPRPHVPRHTCRRAESDQSKMAGGHLG